MIGIKKESKMESKELNKQIEKIYDMAFTNRISPSKQEKYFELNNLEEFPFGGGIKNIVIERIKELLINGHNVRCCYICTSIREYHDRYIVWK